MNRRDFIRAASASGLALAGCSDSNVGNLVDPEMTMSPAVNPLDTTNVEHVVVVTMENRSFDHYLGWLPHADALQSGLSYPDRDGVLQKTYPLAPDYQGCGYHDPDHSYEGGRVEYHDGQCDGWLLAGNNDRFAIGYYRREDLPFLGQAAGGWTSFDRYFSSVLGPTYPNRMYQHCAQTDRLINSLDLSVLPTIWDNLYSAGVSAQYYYSDVPFLALWGTKYLAGPQAVAASINQFYADCASGSLPAVAYVEPQFFDELSGTSNDDHPFADIRAGQTFLNGVYRAITQSPNWASTVLVITYDEWGGFFDHVPPPVGSVEAAEVALGYTDGRLGFRVPTIIASPFAKRRSVCHDVLEHCSILRFIEDRWSLPALTQRDANANSLATALFAIEKNPTKAPQYTVPEVTGTACPTVSAESTAPAGSTDLKSWAGLRELARQYGWPVG